MLLGAGGIARSGTDTPIGGGGWAAAGPAVKAATAVATAVATADSHRIVQSTGLYKLLVDSVRDYAIFALDPTCHIITWNTGAQRFKGYTAQLLDEAPRRRARWARTSALPRTVQEHATSGLPLPHLREAIHFETVLRMSLGGSAIAAG